MTLPDRTLSTDLADDLGWLEEHARRQPSRADRAVLLRFAAGLVRNQIDPAIQDLKPPPLHAAVVGGAGSGKSTVANLLCGANVAEANPQAGFTRHPIAYTHPGGTSGWPSHVGFLGPLRLLETAGPSNIDENLFQVRKLDLGDDTRLLQQFVVWDCPDMTTWAATDYAPRLLEIAALADVIVYVASDERYNDAVPTQYLRMFLQAGKPVVVVLTKMTLLQADDLTAHFKKEVLSDLPRGRVAVLTVPHLTPQELANPVMLAQRYRIPLLNQMTVLAENPNELRQQSVVTGMRFLSRSADALMESARDDVTALDEWSALVRGGQVGFDDRYQREFLSGAKLYRFDEALVRLIDMLELPGVGKFLSSALHVVRTPYRLVKSFIGKMIGPPSIVAIPEQPVLDAAFAAWTDQVRAYALANEKRHDLWAQAVRGFEGDLSKILHDRYIQGLKEFQGGQREEIDATARAIYEDLEKSPGKLNTLRGGKFALDIAAITGSLLMGTIGWHDFIVVPLAAAISQQLVEWLGAGYVELQKEKARQRQRELVARHISRPIGDWLAQWPATGGTSYERLQLALTRIPQSLVKLEDAVAKITP